MARVGRWCFEHRKKVVAIWLLAIVGLTGVSVAVGSSFNSNLSLPGTDSQAAAALLKQNFPAVSGEGDQIVVQATHGTTIQSAPVQSAVTAALAKVAKVPGIENVASPYAKNGAAQISRDGTIAFARVTWDKPSTQVTTADAKDLIGAAQSADGPDVHICLGGQSIENSERPSIGISVVVAVAAALVILLIVFGGALLSSLTPPLTAGLALVIATSLIGLLSHAFDVASVSSELAVLIGLGVGVDYGLFIISRHRSAVKAGLSYSDAAAQAVRTSGRTVLLAGLTVCIALLGQFTLGVSFLYGPSLGAATAVALTMIASLTFLPAMLGFLGPRVLSRRERAALAADGPVSTDPAGFWLRWAQVIQARKALVAVSALAAVAVIAPPIFGLRLGTSDASTDPVGSTTHQAYTALQFCRQVRPSAHRENVRDVAVPQLVLSRRHEVAADQVNQAGRVRRILQRGGLVRPRVHAGQASRPGQAADPLRADPVPVPGQVRVNPVDTVPALMRIMNRHDKRGQCHVFFLPRRRRALLPRIIPLPRYLQHLAHEYNRESFLAWPALVRLVHLSDERELY